ncbi:MAG: hypothetical protein K5694_03565 [Bacilli bacterium]|nr:hypothetical protein [Bacilli bacterium]
MDENTVEIPVKSEEELRKERSHARIYWAIVIATILVAFFVVFEVIDIFIK